MTFFCIDQCLAQPKKLPSVPGRNKYRDPSDLGTLSPKQDYLHQIPPPPGLRAPCRREGRKNVGDRED